MSVARKTPKFGDSTHSRTPLKQPGKSTSPSPSRYLQSPFSNPGIGNRKSNRNSPCSKMTLKESIEALRQIKDYNNSVTGSGNKFTGTGIYDKTEFESGSDFGREPIRRESFPMRNHISKIETFLASRKQQKEEDGVKPHNLAWRAASHDAQARVIKEGASNNQWPVTNLLGQMGELYNKYSHNADKRVLEKESPLKKSGTSISTRRSTRVDEDVSALDQEKYYNKENNFLGRKSVKEGRSSHVSVLSNTGEGFQKSSSSEIEKLRMEASKTKNQMKGKIDFINSLYEELAMQPRGKPLMPSNQPISPAIDSKETPRSLSLVDDAEIDASISNRRRLHKREEQRDINYHENENLKARLDQQATFGDDISGQNRLNHAQKIAIKDIIAEDNSLARKVGDSSVKRLQPEEVYQGSEKPEKKEYQSYEDNNRGEDTARRRENNRPPLPGKRLQEEDSRGFECSEWAETRGSFHQTASLSNKEHKSKKNYIEMNKTSSGVKNKRYTNYEKVLRNVEEMCKPLLETLKNVSTKNESHLNARCTSNRKGKWSPCSAVSSAQKEQRRKSHSIISSPAMKEFPQFENTINKPEEGLGATKSSINCFYEEMNNLTLKITEAANVMQKTLDKLERYKAEDTERGDRSARTREGSPNGRRYGYSEYNEGEMY